MPNEADHKQLKKKRHVGNDHVHIVWNESGTKYQTDTIGGDFGNVQIIITPLESCGKSSLFSVTTFAAKENVVGPLSGTTILMENELAPLVRWTAVNAHCAVNQLKHTFEPVLQREADLGVIGERHVDQNILT